MPKRIQQQRTKGWRKPEGAMSVARPSKWGNPFKASSCLEAGYADTAEGAQKMAAEVFANFMAGSDEFAYAGSDKLRLKMMTELHELTGKDLMCWCREGTPCHADTLLRLANPE